MPPPATPRLPRPREGRRRFGGLFAALVALALPAFAIADTAAVVTDHARPGFAAFATAAEALAAVDSCAPDDLRPAFQAAWDAWTGVAHLSLGPAEDGGRGLAVLFWPDPKGAGWKAQRALLAAGPADLTPETMAGLSVAARGLPALERLLYPAEPLAADPCPLIRATARDMARTAQDLARDWQGFGDLLLSAGQPGNTRFLSPAEATQALFTQLVSGLESLADRRIGRPLGSFDKPRPDLAEARAAGRSQRNILLSLIALRDLAQKLSPDSPQTLAAFDRAIALAETLHDPDLSGIAQPAGRLKLDILQQAVRATRDSAIAEIGPALGVGLGFNALDGD
ncbi:imelysin family protein [Rhodobacter sp. M37P]|uniref:Imelysin family protein n=2 Tax=Rhodobacter calidifons TaxID=2715277 RepID=A0ABX0G6C1_9RHOB|nr:imelysin family protein [Rhodobacter calidifons]